MKHTASQFLRQSPVCCAFLLAVLLLCHAILPASAAPCSEADIADRMAFLGESTTAHLRTRGGLRQEQIWANASGTMKLDAALLSRKLIDTPNGRLTIAEAAGKYRPEILVLSFGLNGIVGFNSHPERYQSQYLALIDCIKAASPDTRILVQSVYPVTADAAERGNWHFTQSAQEINGMIRQLNEQLALMCCESSLAELVDTAGVLLDPEGALCSQYSTDGIHLTSAAYERILTCLCSYLSRE